MSAAPMADLAARVAGLGTRLPEGLDLVVGATGEGLLPATLISLHLNCALASLEDALAGRVIEAGRTRRHARLAETSARAGRILLVVDELGDGAALARARAALGRARPDAAVFACAVRAPADAPGLDFVLDPAPARRARAAGARLP